MGLLALGGCAFVPASQQQVIDAQTANAAAYNAKVQALTPPVEAADLSAIQTWTAGEAASWQALSDWAHHRAPATTQP